MTNGKPADQLYSRIFSRRRMVMLASVACIGAILALGGQMGYIHPSPPWISSARAADSQSQQQPASFADLVAKVQPAVISVRVQIDGTSDVPDLSSNEENLPPSVQGFPFNETSGGMAKPHEIIIGAGSGFFISPDGYAVTNNHVVDHARSVQVTTDDGVTYKAKVIGTDPKSDIALIKVDGKSNFAYVNFAGHAPRVGDWVVAVGNPFGLGGTVTAGIVSAKGRDIGSGPYDDFLQIDAPVNHGNSGGPTFNADGEVVGVNTAIFSPSGGSVGIGFAISSDVVKTVVQQLKDTGSVERGWLGVEIQPVTPDLADSLGVKNASGALVAKETPNSPASSAGVK